LDDVAISLDPGKWKRCTICFFHSLSWYKLKMIIWSNYHAWSIVIWLSLNTLEKITNYSFC
jgi:hypothetical protein